MTDQATTKRQRRMARQPNSIASGTHDATAATKKRIKTDAVVALLARPDGATLDELVAATGWLPHTARAALTGLKKKGHVIERTKLDGVSRYAIVKQVS
jgi:hypothetical protein